MKYKALIFDYGGTIDTPGVHWSRAIWNAYQKCRIPVSEEEYRDAYVYVERRLGSDNIITPDNTFHQTLALKLRMQIDYLQQFHVDDAAFQESVTYLPEMLDMLYTDTSRLVAHNRNILEQIKEIYPLALVSNFYGNLGTVLREFHLEGIFQHVVESAQVNIRKPDPAIFRMAVNLLGVAPKEALVVGDSIKNDILPARSIGCHTAWLTPKADEEQVSVPEIIIESLGQLQYRICL